MASFLDDFFSIALFLSGARISKGAGLNLDGNVFTASLNANTGNVDVGVVGTLPVTNLAVSGNLSVTGTLTQGAAKRIPFAVTTTGSGSAALPSITLAANKLYGFTFEITAWNSTVGGGALLGLPAGAGYGTSGSPGLTGAGGTTTLALGLNPANPVTNAYIGGALTLTVHGPSTTVTGAANNGSGKVRLTVASCDSVMSGQSLDISGIVGTTEANGTHVGTYVDSTHIDLLTVNYVNAYVSGGTVVYTGSPSTSWVGWMQVVTP